MEEQGTHQADKVPLKRKKDHEGKRNFSLKVFRTSLVVWWLGIHLPVQGTWV